MASIFRSGAILAMAVLSACHEKEQISNGIKIDMIAKHISPFRLGDDFEIAARAGNVRWWRESYDECIADMALKGCTLSPLSGEGHVVHEGIPFRIRLRFSTEGRLAAINHIYIGRRDISRSECIALHGRMIDMLTGVAPGLQLFIKPIDQESIKAGWRRYIGKTPAGRSTSYASDAPDTAMFDAFAGGQKRDPELQSANSIKGPYVSTFGYFLTIGGKPMCELSYEITENSFKDVGKET